jgi:hypothetical protein
MPIDSKNHCIGAAKILPAGVGGGGLAMFGAFGALLTLILMGWDG